MATLTNEQIEQKKQQLKQLAEEMKALKDELVEAGALPSTISQAIIPSGISAINKKQSSPPIGGDDCYYASNLKRLMNPEITNTFLTSSLTPRSVTLLPFPWAAFRIFSRMRKPLDEI